jgi:hypothetical protein
MDLLLTALSGIAWTIVYVDSIRIGLTQKTYAMPIAALGLNIAWEWTYAVLPLWTSRVPELCLQTPFHHLGHRHRPHVVPDSVAVHR